MKAITRFTVATLIVISSSAAGAVRAAQTSGDSAQAYPNRPIRLMVQFQPGTSTDIATRVIAQKLTETWGHQVIADNRPGAGGTIATEIGARATPDGYTLTMAPAGAIGIAPALYSKLPYDVLRDFAAITNLVTVGQVLISSPALPAKTVPQVVAAARSQPGTMNYGSTSTGTASHLAMEMFQSVAKVKLNHVPFKGSPAAHLDLMSGQIQLMIDGLPAALPLIKSGKIRGIAVTSLERQKLAPDLPPIAESYPGFEAIGWVGILAPAKTPPAILDKLNREIVRIVNLSDTRERFDTLGFMPAAGTRAQHTTFIRSEIQKWTRVVRDAGVKVE